MEEEKKQKTFTEKEVMDMVSKMQKDYTVKMLQCNRTIQELNGTLNKLSFLLQIVNSQNVHLYTETFITKCVEEIESIMTPEEETSNAESDESR